jgi:hypothetical protein
MRDHKDIIALVGAIVISVVAACLLQLGDTTETPQPPVPGFNNYVVKVTAHNPKESHVGTGILVQHNDVVFVLTSKMIFTPTDTSYDVLYGGRTFSAWIVLKDEARGLVVLDLPVNFGGCEIDDAPNLPPCIETEVYGWDNVYDVTIKKYLTNPDWMILDGGIPGTCTGAPIIHGGRLAGIVIGVSTENPDEAFAVGNHAIREFAEVVAAPVLHVPPGPILGWEPLEFQSAPYNQNDMRNVFREPANPNLLFQGM